MTIDNLLTSDHARRTYEHISDYYSEDELAQFMFIMADYCNERAFHKRVQDELNDSDLIVEVTNNKCKKNESSNKLATLLNQSAKRILDLEKELMLTPKANEKRKKGGEIDGSDMDV